MRCQRSQEMISLLLDDVIGEKDRILLLEHLTECGDCRQHHAVLERGRVALREHMVEPPENFEWKVQLGIQRALRDGAAGLEEAPRSAFWRPALASAAVVALLVVGVGSSLLFQGGDVESPSMASSPAVFADAAPAEALPAPDLSGAVRGTPLDIDATGKGFGIRLVGADPSSRGPLYSPAPNRFYDAIGSADRSHPPVLFFRLASPTPGLNAPGGEAILRASTTVTEDTVSVGDNRR